MTGFKMRAGMALNASPSVFFDAVAVLSGQAGDPVLSKDPDAVSFLADAYRHRKAIGYSGVPELTGKTVIADQPGIIALATEKSLGAFVEAARTGRFWERRS